MKRLLLVPLIFLLTACGYGSRYEAEEACKKWEDKGAQYIWVKGQETVNRYEWVGLGSYRRKVITPVEEETLELEDIRKCKAEEDTNQVMGMQMQGVKRFDKYQKSELNKKKNFFKVVKRFKY